MVVDTTYYDILQVESTVTDIELKKAYRKQAIKLHPDKNGNDPKAAEKFQELGEAYQVLQNPDSRKIYDEFGVEGMKEKTQGVEQDINPEEFFQMIFGGTSFKEWIGDLGMFNELTKSAEILGDEDELADETILNSNINTTTATSTTGETLESKTQSLSLADSKTNQQMTPEDIKRKRKQKLSKEKREELLKVQEESRIAKQKRVEELSSNLVKKLESYILASKNKDSLASFTTKLQQEFDDMKIESFGIQLLHLIGKIYSNQAHATISSSKTFGVSKIYTSVKSSTETMKNGYSILKTALDAQDAMEKSMKEQEEFMIKKELGYEPTQEETVKQMEKERLMTGKFLATGWSLIKFEITNVLNKVCHKVLNDKELHKKERVARANALLYIGKEMLKVERSPEEEEEARIFEEMMADAQVKKSSKAKKK